MASNILTGKTIVFDGDSICQASSETKETNRGWPYRIGEKNGMKWYNVGIGGGTITAKMYSKVTGMARHWISRNIDVIYENFPELDYLILEGGTNDADLIDMESEQYGTIDSADFSGNYDDTTFCGACESLFFKAIHYYPKTKIGFIIAPKMGVENNHTVSNKRRAYFLKMIEICKKWGIPYLDLWDGCPLNPRLEVYYDGNLDAQGNRDAGKAYVDGQHLTKVGYDIISPKIEAWIRTL